MFEFFESFFTIALAATLISFIFGYPVHWLQRFGLSRPGAVAIVLLSGVLVLGVAGFLLLPPLASQISDLASRLPDLISSSNGSIQGLQEWATQQQLPIDVSSVVVELESRLSAQVQAVSGLIVGAIPAAIF